jgi:hypothetical protein
MSKFTLFGSEKGNNNFRDLFGELNYYHGKYIADNNGEEPLFLVLHRTTHAEYVNKLEKYDKNPPGAHDKSGSYFFYTLIITTSMIQAEEFFFVG